MSGSRTMWVAGVGTAVPPLEVTQPAGLSLLEARFGRELRDRSLRVLRQVFSHPAIRARRFALVEPTELFDEPADDAMARFGRWAVALGREALADACAQASLSATDLAGLVVNTCTGYLCPGLSGYLVETLHLRRDLPVYDLVGAGCAGALPALELAMDLARRVDRPTAVISVEITSATFRMGNDPSLLVSNALFGDGASAMVVDPAGGRLRVTATERTLAPEHRDHVRYLYRGGRLANRITARLPRLTGEAARVVVARLLTRHGLEVPDVPHWALHPGGESILEAVAAALSLPAEALAPARSVLARLGNMSSATTGFVLRSILDGGVGPGEKVVALTYGAGMAAHAALLEGAR